MYVADISMDYNNIIIVSEKNRIVLTKILLMKMDILISGSMHMYSEGPMFTSSASQWVPLHYQPYLVCISSFVFPITLCLYLQCFLINFVVDKF